MGRHSKTQKKVQASIQDAPIRRPRKKREVQVPPPPFKLHSLVKVTSPDDFKGIKLGFIKNICQDGGINVQLTKPRHEGIADFVCIHSDRSQTIELIEEHDK